MANRWNGLRTSLEYLALALRRKFVRAVADDTAPEVWVVSPGGVGTTAFMWHVSRFRSVNAPDDTDERKHIPRPPHEKPGCKVRYIFITGPSGDIYRSLSRRGWVEVQGALLGAFMPVILRGRPQQQALAAAVARQRRHWTGQSSDRVLVLDYAELWDAAEKVAAFLDIQAPEFITGYPRKRPRSVPAETQDQV